MADTQRALRVRHRAAGVHPTSRSAAEALHPQGQCVLRRHDCCHGGGTVWGGGMTRLTPYMHAPHVQSLQRGEDTSTAAMATAAHPGVVASGGSGRSWWGNWRA